MKYNTCKHWVFSLALLILPGLGVNSSFAQTTAFTYQGKLTDSNLPANVPHDFQFKLFDALSGGTQVGATVASNGVAVNNGVFSVTLDFGAAAFPGAPRWLEISLRPAGAGTFTPLAPRQPVTVVPYAIKSLSAATADGLTSVCVGCVSGAQIGSLPTNSGSYIQNQNAAPQASSNFNISGNGTAGGTLSGNIVNATTQYNLGGARILSTAGTNNLFAGVNAGAANTGGNDNAFFGHRAGALNDGPSNSFFGSSAGAVNTSGFENAFFGTNAGAANTTGVVNAFFGSSAGASNTVSLGNAFFGTYAGLFNTTGNYNAFFGTYAGDSNMGGSSNTAIGTFADVGSGNLTNATAIGAGAIVTASSMVQIGRVGVDTIAIGAFANPATSTAVCINGMGVFTNCTASSLRYKESVQPLHQGLRLIQRLRPVTFNWKEGHQPDLGLIAEEVAAVEPLLNTYNRKGELEGVKYTQLTVVLINAVKEQQAQLETLRAANVALQVRLRAVEKVLRKKAGAARQPR